MNAFARLFGPSPRDLAASFCESCSKVSTAASRAVARLDQLRTSALHPTLVR